MITKRELKVHDADSVENTLKDSYGIVATKYHLFSTYATFFEEFTFLTPRYGQVRVRIRG